VLRIYPQTQPADGHPVPGLRAGAAPVPGRGHPDRQRARVRRQLPLARPGQGTGHLYIKPRTPRLNGKVERSHRIDAEEFYRLLEGMVIDDAQVFNDRLREWEDFYNYHRPHGSLGGQTPYERLKQRTQARV
jgi:transposase InsO family protein